MIALFDVTIVSHAGSPPVLRDLSIQLEKGKWHEIIGAAGSGKSALFDVMTLRRRPKTGRLVIAGRNMERLGRRGLAEIRREIGSCTQQPMLLEQRTAVENVVLPMVVRGAAGEAVEAAEEALGFLGIMPQRDRRVAELCAQHRALVCLARATVGAPSVVVIDGIHERLEPAVRGIALTWLEQTQKQGSTIVVFGRRPIHRRSGSSLWRLKEGAVHNTGEVERC